MASETGQSIVPSPSPVQTPASVTLSQNVYCVLEDRTVLSSLSCHLIWTLERPLDTMDTIVDAVYTESPVLHMGSLPCHTACSK